jgi:high-affinity Fe2+/Pb2+ permease
MVRLDTGQVLGLGVTLGAVLGFALGFLLALLFGDEALGAVQRLTGRFGGNDGQINFELLTQ